MRPHGIKPCNISRWDQLQGCMCLHTQSPKIPKPVIRAAQLTAVFAAAISKVTGSRVESLQGVCKCVFQHKLRSMKKTLHACVCLSVYVSSVLYLAALNSSASCNLNHEHEVIQLMIERVCVCVCLCVCVCARAHACACTCVHVCVCQYCISEWEGIGRILQADCDAALVGPVLLLSLSFLCVCV